MDAQTREAGGQSSAKSPLPVILGTPDITIRGAIYRTHAQYTRHPLSFARLPNRMYWIILLPL